jgi:acetoin utilization deacetylase AcuC-like enzyme
MAGGVYFDHPACLEHDPRAGIPLHPDTPERLHAVLEGGYEPTVLAACVAETLAALAE